MGRGKVMNNIDILEEIKQNVLEEIKQKYKISNKYMLCLKYEDIGILIRIIEVLEGINTKLMKEQKDNFIPKSKVEEKIHQFESIRDEILKIEKELKRPSITYDLKRNDYCLKILQELLEE